MERADTRLPDLQLDPKRIAATSVAIAVHMLVLMLLLLPAQRPAHRAAIEERSLIVVPDIKKTPPPPPLPLVTRPRPIAEQRVPMPQVLPVDTTPSPVDEYVPPQPTLPEVVDSYDPPSLPQAFAQIAADVAPAPPYPPQALTRRLSGEVLLRVRVDASGRPLEASIERSSGWKVLDEAARKFVLARWHFVPAFQDGVSIEAQALVPINFVLER